MSLIRLKAAFADMANKPMLLPDSFQTRVHDIVSDMATGKRVDYARLCFSLKDGPALAPVTVRSSKASGKSIAIVPVCGMCNYEIEWQPFAFSTRRLAADVARFAADDSIGSIVLLMDTPGGHVTGVPEAADAILAARDVKPVSALVDSMSASAGYWLASQASEIISVPSGEVGSIGVWMLHTDVSGALEQMGIKATFISAGKYKVEGNSLEPLGDEARDFLQQEVDKIYGDFLKAVARGRKVRVSRVEASYGQGRVLGSADALAAGMIDSIKKPADAAKKLGLAAGPVDGEAPIDPMAERMARADSLFGLTEESVDINGPDVVNGDAGAAQIEIERRHFDFV